MILGKPNAGKSSLLNALLGYDRAIVTDVAGTTRDTVEEKVQVGHVLLRLCDTAGLRDTGDAVEQLGGAAHRDAARQAALALLVLDGSRPLTVEDEDAIATAAAVPRQLVIVNKTDLPRRGGTGGSGAALRAGLSPVRRHGRGRGRPVPGRGGPVPRRKAGAGRASHQRPAGRRRGPQSGGCPLRPQGAGGRHDPDAVLTDAEAALEALGELNGKRIREDLVQTIFSRFCVGK